MTTKWSLSAATGRGDFQGTVSAAPYGIVANTDKRDVSDMLDLLALADTPFINRVGWGPESGAVAIEWISEDLGPGVLANLSQLESVIMCIAVSTVDGLSAANSMYQIQEGSVLYAYNSVDASHTLMAVCTITGTVSFTISTIAAQTMTHHTSIEAGNRFFVLGHVVNEGSKPFDAKPRQRVVASNNFTILRQDVAISGSMKATDMYAIGREDQHQILMRMKEMQRQRERVCLYSDYSARSTSMPGTMYGVLGFLLTQSGGHIDSTTKVLTEAAFNDVVGTCWEYGSENLEVFGARAQIAKFTQWDKNRIRQTVNEGKGGGYISSYLTEAGIEVKLHPMRQVPRNAMFVLDPIRIKLRAKKGRKALMQKLGLMGDSEDWQIISEFSLEMKGYNLRQHGVFTALTPSA